MSAEVALFEKTFAIGANAEAIVSLFESSQGLFLQLQTKKGPEKSPNARSKTIIPAALLPEIKRAISEVERILSDRGELEITDINNAYIEMDELDAKRLGRNVTWLDAGTYDSLLDAARSVRVLQKGDDKMRGSPEEVAFRQGYIDRAQLIWLASAMQNSEYGSYLLRLADEAAETIA